MGHNPLDGLQAEGWQCLLCSLDPDPRRAASRYELLRRRLIALFRRRDLRPPEDLADEAFDRVARRLACGMIVRHDVGSYLFGVARLIACEAARRARREQPLDGDVAVDAVTTTDEALARLGRCLDSLPADTRRILLDYEAGSGSERIMRRKQLAAELGIACNALRIRMHRLRARLAVMMTAGAQAQG